MKYFPLLIICFSLTSCSIIKRNEKFPMYLGKQERKAIKSNSCLFVLERWDALIVNKMSVLFMMNDSMYTIDKNYFKNNTAITRNELIDDQEILKKYSKRTSLDSSNYLIYCNDCDRYNIYKIHLGSSKKIYIDTLFSGSKP